MVAVAVMVVGFAGVFAVLGRIQRNAIINRAHTNAYNILRNATDIVSARLYEAIEQPVLCDASGNYFPAIDAPTGLRSDGIPKIDEVWEPAAGVTFKKYFGARKTASATNAITGIPDPTTGRYATETTYNVAVMAGTIPSGYDPTPSNTTNGDTYGASGGAHNFPRMLERWKSTAGTNVNMNFKGSMVQLFTSRMFNGAWGTGEIYRPPNRVWSYNEDFTRHPSPGLFSFTFFTRGPWRRE